MSVNVSFYQAKGDPKRVIKDLTLIATKSCELKGDCSVQSPVLIVKGDPAAYALCNYMYLPAFKRYYYVDEVVSMPGGMLRISAGKCDLLASAWPYIRDLDAVIDRQQDAWNLYLNDGTFQAQANDMIQTKEFKLQAGETGFDGPGYVLVIAG